MFIDIAFNATSPHFINNLEEIISNSKKANVMPICVGLDIDSSKKCLEISKMYNTCCFMGIHPLSIAENTKFDLEKTFDLNDLHIAGIGECGLDFFRSDDKYNQIHSLEQHFKIEKLPFFYHCRNAANDLISILKTSRNPKVFCGVVHSFDGSLEEALEFISLGLYIGINGCSFKTEENLEVVKKIPIEKILIETDSPYCLVRKSYAGSKYIEIKKAKYNEPSFLLDIATILSKLKNIPMEELEEILFKNTLNVFPNIKKFTKYFTN